MNLSSIIAFRPDASYLVDAGNGLVRVVDLGDETVSAPLPLDSVLARGYWEDPPAPSGAVVAGIGALIEAADAADEVEPADDQAGDQVEEPAMSADEAEARKMYKELKR